MQGAGGVIDDGNPVFHRTLDPYRAKGCIYLRSASVGTDAEGRIVAEGRFAIAESSYIDDTGHFNAAEFVMCFNQLMYLSIARAIELELSAELAGWTLEDFWQRQLPDVLIHKLESTYSRPISAAGFTARFEIVRWNSRAKARGMTLFDTTVRFMDDAGGLAHGAVSLALVNIPDRARG